MMDALSKVMDIDGRTGVGGRPMLGSEELRRVDAYWRAANYLSVGQIEGRASVVS